MARLVVTRAPDIVMGPGAEVQIQSDAVPPPATSPAVTFYIRTHSAQHFPSPCRLSAATTLCVSWPWPPSSHPARHGKYNQTIYWRRGGELGVFSISGMLQTSISEYLTYSDWLLLPASPYLCAIFMRAQVTVSRELQLPPALIRSL